MKGKFFLSLGLLISLFGVVSCTAPEPTPTPDPDTGDKPEPQVELEVTFDFNEDHLSIVSKDDITKKDVGDNFKFELKLNDGTKVNSVIANDEPAMLIGSNRYSFSLKKGKNTVKITSISTSKQFVAEKLDVVPNATSSNLFTNWGYPHFPTTGDQKLLVIPVTIKGHETNATKENKEKIEKAFFGDSSNTYFESVSSYYKKSSYGKLNITGTVTDWYPLDLTEGEIYSLRDSVYGDNGIFEVSNRAIDWVKKSQPSINLDEYDNNDDGFIDGIYFVYSALDALTDLTVNPEYVNLRWNHTFYNIRNSGKKAPKTSPIPMTYSWSSFNMVNWYDQHTTSTVGQAKKGIDAHTYIHEFGHQLGLDDYYDTSISSGKAYTSPMGGIDMMDNNVGDHSMYSKYALGWTAPTRISGNTGEIEVTLKPSYKDGNFAIITGEEFNGLPFDEYIAIEYLSNENNPNNLNYHDSVNSYPTTATADGTRISSFGESGIRVTHIDARAIDNNQKYTDDVNKMVRTKFTNTGSTKDGYRDPKTNNNYVLTTLISANKSRNVQGTLFTADSTDLFKEGNKFNFKENVENTYVNCLPSLTNKLNDGTKLNYEVTVKSLTATEAKIVIKAI